MTRRFMAAFMAVGLLVLLVQDVPLARYLKQVETDRIMTSLQRDAFVLAGRSEEALHSASTDDDDPMIELAQAYRSEGGARVVIVDATGSAVVVSDDDQSSVGTAYGSRPEIARALTGAVATGSRYSKTLQMDLLYVTVPVISGGDILGAVRLTYPQDVVDSAVNSQLRRLAIVALTSVLIAGIVAYVLARSVTRPLGALRLATVALAGGDLTVRADEGVGAPEIRSLSTSFNQMAVQLDTLLAQQRTFAADASHQLRTPLTALRLRLERARELLDTDPTGAEKRLDAADLEAQRLATLVDGLLLLSHMDAGEAERKAVDLADVAQGRVDAWQPLAAELGLVVTIDAPSPTPVLAAPTAAEQIIDNYIDNAMSASKAGDTIHVAVIRDNATSVVRVVDQGPGLSPEDCERAFVRFWRAESESTGTGLGLAIVARLAEASGARVKLERSPAGGLVASAAFETAPPPADV